MMTAGKDENPKLPVLRADLQFGGVSGAVSSLFRIAPMLLVLLSLLNSEKASAQATMQLLQAPGGLGGIQLGNNYFSSFGTMNALGIGTPATGVTVAALSNGA